MVAHWRAGRNLFRPGAGSRPDRWRGPGGKSGKRGPGGGGPGPRPGFRAGRPGLGSERKARPKAYSGRTVNTGMGALLTTFSATEPNRMRSMPLRPWVPMTIMSAPFSWATVRISSAA